jgi:hypothetical protein
MERAMARLRLEQSSRFGLISPRPGRTLDLRILIVLVAVPALLIVWLVPLPLVLPALSMVSFAIAGCTAVLAYHAGADRHADAITLWDIAGAYALIWVGAGVFTDPERVIQLFDQMAMAR